MVKIIKARKENVAQICQLFNEYDKEIEKYFPKNHLKLLQKLHHEHGDNPQRRKNIVQAILDKKQLFLVAKENDTIVGCVIGWIEPIARVGKFDQLILTSQSKDKETLNKLYSELEKWFKSKNCPYIVVNVVAKNPRKRLYETFGFRTVLEEMRKIVKKSV